jgi:hypothetical protein
MLAGSVRYAVGQIENRLAVGLSTTGQIADSSRTDGTVTFGLEWRFGHSKPGWGWQYAFNWFDTGVNQPIAGQKVDFGHLHIRPVMGGYGYTWVRGRTSLTADLVAGYAFSSFDLSPAADEMYRARLGARTVTSEAGNTFVVNPEVHGWYDLTKRIGLKISGGLMVARPSVTMFSTLGEDRRDINADTFMINVSAVYKIF